jgi:hypothetical protein
MYVCMYVCMFICMYVCIQVTKITKQIGGNFAQEKEQWYLGGRWGYCV